MAHLIRAKCPLEDARGTGNSWVSAILADNHRKESSLFLRIGWNLHATVLAPSNVVNCTFRLSYERSFAFSRGFEWFGS